MDYQAKHPTVLATLLFITTSALPALAVPMPALRDAAATPIELVQNRPAPHPRMHRAIGHHNDGTDAAHAHASAPPAANGNGDTGNKVPGWPNCVNGFDGSAASAFPMWDVCR